MYNKLFSKILDSSVWMESKETRLVWLTLIAAMDEDGYAHFASPKNLAQRAVLTLEETESAIKVLESPDPYSADPDNDGRRVERIPGGWIVLNAGKYREIVTRQEIREGTRRRMAKHRASTKSDSEVTDGPSHERHGDGDVTSGDDPVTQSEAEADTEADTEEREEGADAAQPSDAPERAQKATTKKPPETADEMLARLCANPTYEDIDVRREYGKAQSWCSVNHRILTPKFFINWLNRADRPFAVKQRQKEHTANSAQATIREAEYVGPNLGAMPTAELEKYLTDLEAKKAQ